MKKVSILCWRWCFQTRKKWFLNRGFQSPLGRLEILDFFMNRERPIGKTLLFTDRLALFGRCYEWPSELNQDSSLEKSILAANFFKRWPACFGLSIGRFPSLSFGTCPALMGCIHVSPEETRTQPLSTR